VEHHLDAGYTSKFEGSLEHLDSSYELKLEHVGYCTEENIKHFFKNVVSQKTDRLRSSFIKYRQAINKFAITL
jgi:hypothetical protein